MELKDNIASLRELSERLEAEIAVEDASVKEYLTAGRKRMAALDTKRERLYHIQAAINNIQALVDEEQAVELPAVTEDPWA